MIKSYTLHSSLYGTGAECHENMKPRRMETLWSLIYSWKKITFSVDYCTEKLIIVVEKIKYVRKEIRWGKETRQMVNMGEVERDSDRKRNNFTSDQKISPNFYINPQKYHFSENRFKYFLQQFQNRCLFQVLKDISKDHFSLWSSLL